MSEKTIIINTRKKEINYLIYTLTMSEHNETYRVRTRTETQILRDILFVCKITFPGKT